jgi:hypothetical protein
MLSSFNVIADAILSPKGMAADNTTQANGMKMKFKTTMKDPTQHKGLQLVLVFSSSYLHKSSINKNATS